MTIFLAFLGCEL